MINNFPRPTDRQNGLVSGYGWSDDVPMIIAFDGVIADLQYWADKFETSPETLRRKVNKAHRGIMRFEQAMLNKAQRKNLYRPITRPVHKKTRDATAENAYNSFCLGGRNVGAR